VAAQQLPQPLPTDGHRAERVIAQVVGQLTPDQCVNGRPSFSGRVVAVWMMNA
jgi:hypothetical protein